MWDIVYLMVQEFVDMLPTLATLFLVLGIVGNMVFRNR